MVCGLASIDGVTYMFIGHQKGRNTKENIHRNFGMPQPNGYRKALRFMRHADKFGFPIVTFVDTPGAYAGKTAEELGQGEAIAVNLREMFGFRVPILSVVIGEGGSGGALAIGCANRNMIMQNAVYYVASPEACAAILWKSRDKAGTATEALKITSSNLVQMGIMDEIIPEPQGGAHANPMEAFPAIREAIVRNFENYRNMSEEDIKLDRYAKFRKIGTYSDYVVRGGDLAGAAEVTAARAVLFTRPLGWRHPPRSALSIPRGRGRGTLRDFPLVLVALSSPPPRLTAAPPAWPAGEEEALRGWRGAHVGGDALRDGGGGGADRAAGGRGREVGGAH